MRLKRTGKDSYSFRRYGVHWHFSQGFIIISVVSLLCSVQHKFQWETKKTHTMLFMWVFPKIVVPQIIHFNRVFHYKPSILGYPSCWKHPVMINPTSILNSWFLGKKLRLEFRRALRPNMVHPSLRPYDLMDNGGPWSLAKQQKDVNNAMSWCTYCWWKKSQTTSWDVEKI